MPKIQKKKLISLDTETTGLDLWHGAKAYFITTCDENDEQLNWYWPVDPFTREPYVSRKDCQEISELLRDPQFEWVLQNAKFDVRSLATVGIDVPEDFWFRCHETLYSGHLLASDQPKNLTSMVMNFLKADIGKFDKRLESIVKEVRGIVRKMYPEWRIAKEGLPEMPSAKSTVWKTDSWLPLSYAEEKGLEIIPEDHPYRTVTFEYANTDSAATLQLFLKHRRLLKERGLWKMYQQRLKMLPIVYRMENDGVTLSEQRLEELISRFQEESESHERVCKNIAKSFDYELTLPKSGVNLSLGEFVFEKLKLPVVEKSEKTGKPGMSAKVLSYWEKTERPGSKKLVFVKNLRAKRKRDTAVQYMNGYRRFWLPTQKGWYVLHPALNPTGTSTLRWSSSAPNEQNISKQEGFNLRYAFGPMPGREWWAIDYDNLELRIPAYECKEPAMLELFEKPDDPPYFGSYHLLIFSILHPDKYDRNDPQGLNKAKKKYAASWYRRTKIGNFADLYGAQESSGTADEAFGMRGAQRIVAEKLNKKTELADHWIDFANSNGYVETMPDKTVDETKGYPLVCRRSNWGSVSPTIPLNYRVQGTACWIMMRAMIEIQKYFDQEGLDDYRMVMNVHDELVFDFPFVADRGNLPIVQNIQRIMERLGEDLIPQVRLTVGIDYHETNWGEGVAI